VVKRKDVELLVVAEFHRLSIPKPPGPGSGGP
jgi:hypothetical protein